jgi:photosystem II stability/assembly factor-like uncharacterized protein
MAFAGLLAASPALAAPGVDNTWTALGTLPQPQDRPLLALASDPSDGRVVLVGTAAGEIYRSADGGHSWRLARSGLGRGVAALAFSPFKPGLVLAGTRGSGIWRSSDGGVSWQPQAGTESRSARSFSFTKSLALAGTDQGILVSRDLGSWGPSGLAQVTVSALAAPAVNEPIRVVAGGDGSRGTEALPLYTSADGGQSWAPVSETAAGSSMVATLVAGPVSSQQTVRPLLLGTNTGLFISTDNGATWQQLTAGGSLPATDFTAAAFVTTHSERFYVASDGGASQVGGIWSTTDSGGHFTSLSPPVPSLTALAVTNDDTPTIYAATFRGSDHSVLLWSYRDAGGQPKGPATLPAAAPGAHGKAAAPAPRASRIWFMSLLTGPEAPYLVLGFLAFLVMMVAVVTHFRRARRL